MPNTAKALYSSPSLPGRQAVGGEAAQRVVRSFNTWAFKREHPTEPELLIERITECMAIGAPLQFVLYWGKGPRSTAEQPDLACLDFLHAMRERIAEAYPGSAEIVLCQTDTHARLNGHSEQSIESYFSQIDEAADVFAFQTVRLSALVDALPEHAGAEPPPDHLLDDLERCAIKWFRGDGEARAGAKRYLDMNMIESRAVACRYPKSIFVTFNGSAYRDLFPKELPVFYMYSLRRGFSVKPWFLDADGQPYAGATAMA